MEPYSLYHTLNRDVDSKKLSLKQKKELVKEANNLDENGKEAFLMLVCEHARINDDYNFLKKKVLPYNGVSKNGDIIFEINKFPPQLCYILIKFLKIVKK